MDNAPLRTTLKDALQEMLRDCKTTNPNKAKLGQLFQAHVQTHFHAFGLPLTTASEDTNGAKRINRAGACLWRVRRTGEPWAPPGSSRIDLVLRKAETSEVFALVEVESDIDDVRNPTRAGDKNYFVQSIARNSSGFPFNSYHSIERMAIACATLAGMDTSVHALESITSNDPKDHNPLAIPLFLVNCAGPQPSLLRVLEARVQSLGLTVVY